MTNPEANPKLTTPGEQTPERAALLAKTTNILFDHLALTNDKFFRKVTEDAITEAEYGQVQILAAANFLRYMIHRNVSKDSVDFVITQIMNGMYETPPEVIRPENEDLERAQKAEKKIITDLVG